MSRKYRIGIGSNAQRLYVTCVGSTESRQYTLTPPTRARAPLVTTTCTRLRRATESRIRAELERKDPSGSMGVSEQALGKVLGKFGADPTGADLGRLMHRFDVHEVNIHTCVCVLVVRGHDGCGNPLELVHVIRYRPRPTGVNVGIGAC